jgi:hypothetical protein
LSFNDKLTLLKTYLFILSLLVAIQICNIPLFAQEVPHSVKNTGVYDFLDELAGKQIIQINSVIKPYSRLFISNRLKEADTKREQLTPRQQKELDFYLKDFGKEFREGKDWNRRLDLLYYMDSLFSLTVNPILGGEIFSNSSGTATYWRNGVEARGYIGRWGFYASLRDNHEESLLGDPDYLSKREGGHIKNNTDWSDMQGGVTWSWKWGNIGLVKDRVQWGDNYNGANIFGGNNPTYTQLKLKISPVKWFDFSYFHGWLTSMVVDSANSFWVMNSYGTDYREVYHKKYIAANMFTFIPLKNLYLSFGNSIIYDSENVNPAYLIPVFFYKSVDHSQTSGINNMNSQMFLNISSRQIRKVHLYASLFIDELSTDRITNPDEWNYFSYKAGIRLTDLPFPNFSFTTEFTYSYPLTYQHNVPTTTFETANYNMGHYLRDNSRELYVALNYKPVRAMDINLFFIDAIRGPDYNELGGSRIGNPPLASIEWHNTVIGLKASYQVINDLYTWFSASSGNITGDERWSPEYFYGKKTTLNFGVTAGF